MKTSFPQLRLRQLDAALERWRSADLPPRPPSGWIRAIRDGLGMSATYLASRLGVATSTVTRLESSEADETISLSTLRRAAEALDCELRYALVPRQSLEATLEARAAALALEQMSAISHSMALAEREAHSGNLTGGARRADPRPHRRPALGFPARTLETRRTESLNRMAFDLPTDTPRAPPRFTWGSANLVDANATRQRYIAALQAADARDIVPLLAFARS
jgi:predicted DNA-binding mobile mystery protein A